MVGNPESGGGLSGGQRRRLSLAVELVGNPRVIICDEPLTGLDSVSAAIVLRALRRRATSGRASVLISVHQPSHKIWHEFDRVIVMGSGGYKSFDGSVDDALSFFRGFGLEFDEGTNPGEYILETMARSKPSLIYKEFMKSDYHRSVCDRVHSLQRAEETPTESLHCPPLYQEFPQASIEHSSPYQTAPIQNVIGNGSSDDPTCLFGRRWTEQVALLCERSFRHYARDPRLLFGYNLLTVLVALTSGLLYFHVDSRLQGAINRSGFFTVTIIFNFLVSLISIDLCKCALLSTTLHIHWLNICVFHLSHFGASLVSSRA